MINLIPCNFFVIKYYEKQKLIEVFSYMERIFTTISTIRREKDIKVNSLLNDDISRASYNRFITGKTDISSSKLLTILNRLHVSLAEVEYISNGYASSKEEQYFEQLRNDLKNKDIYSLLSMRTFFDEKCKLQTDIVYQHLLGLTDVYIARLNNNKLDITENCLFKYLIRTATWTKYELMLFRELVFYIPPQTLRILLNRAVRHLKDIDGINSHYIESFRVLGDAIITFLHHGERMLAIHYIKQLEQYNLGEEHIYEKIILKYLLLVKRKIQGCNKKLWEKDFENLLFVLEILNLPNLKDLVANSVKNL